MNLMIVIFKTLFIYVLVAIIFRVMGKREVGQLGTFDLVVFILIAELVALALEHKDGFLINLVPVIILVLLQIVIAKISLKSAKFRNFVDGKPVIIIKNNNHPDILQIDMKVSCFLVCEFFSLLPIINLL